MEEQTNTTRVALKTKKTKRLYATLAVVIFAALVVVVFKVTSSHISNKTTPVAVVHITRTGFQPATLYVKRGTRVIWTNSDSSLHQVASNPYPKDTGLPGLKSEILNNAQAYTYVANTAGSFGYHDQINPTVNGTLVVKK